MKSMLMVVRTRNINPAVLLWKKGFTFCGVEVFQGFKVMEVKTTQYAKFFFFVSFFSNQLRMES